MVIPTHEDGARLYASVSIAWRAEGYARFEMENFEVLALGQDSRLVSFDWLMLSEHGDLIRRWRQSYQLIGPQGAWQVFTSTFHKP
jgi:7-keto-8-aminopelargonate synthetase-like enzyme